MTKLSRAAAAEHRTAILDVAATVFCERGIETVSIANVMNRVGMTHGGFYGHFSSKDDLAVAACAHSFERLARDRRKLTLEALVDRMLGRNCPIVCFAPEAARADRAGPFREAYTSGVERVFAVFEYLALIDGSRMEQHQLRAIFNSLVGANLVRAAAGEQEGPYQAKAAALAAISATADRHTFV